MSHTRNRWMATGTLAGFLWLTPFAATQQANRAEVMFEAASKKELVDGDLKGAIEQYQKIVATYGSNRAAAAKALVRMGQCYEKLGDLEAGEARKAYERVLRDYADQKEAVSVARARLGRSESAQRAGAMSSRQVWTLPPSGTI